MTKLNDKEKTFLHDVMDDYRYDHEGKEWYEKTLVDEIIKKLSEEIKIDNGKY